MLYVEFLHFPAAADFDVTTADPSLLWKARFDARNEQMRRDQEIADVSQVVLFQRQVTKTYSLV